MKDQISIERIKKLHPSRGVRNTFAAFIDECEAVFKTTFRVVQGLRTFAEQDALYNQPRDKKDNDLDGRVDEADEKVTSAVGGKSFHNYGLAIDIVEMINGKPNWNFPYHKLERIATKYNITWGGAWKDNPHFQITFGIPQKQYIQVLYKRYLNKDFLPGTQYVNL